MLVLLPFIGAGRAGTLGMNVDNDMAMHLEIAETIQINGKHSLLNGYPLGPHAVVATLASGLGCRVDLAFAGLTIAVPILIGWTALLALRKTPWIGQVVAATVTGAGFLIASYVGAGSFKEPIQALFVLAALLMLAGCGPELGHRRWVPFALLVAGMLSVYSVAGLVWPGALLSVWLVHRAVRWRATGRRLTRATLQSQAKDAALGCAVLFVAIIPQLASLTTFLSAYTKIPLNDLGNLYGPLPFREAFGVWNDTDFRLAPPPALSIELATLFVVALVAAGAVRG